MRTLKQIREAIERNRAEYRRMSGLNQGVIRGAVDTSELQAAIDVDIREYNQRSKRDYYDIGILRSRME